MSRETPYDAILPPSRLDKAVDAAIDAVNAEFLASPESQAAAEADGERWRAIMAAEEAAGPSATVLPMGLARDLLRLLIGEVPVLPRHLVVTALRDRIGQAERRGEAPHQG